MVQRSVADRSSPEAFMRPWGKCPHTLEAAVSYVVLQVSYCLVYTRRNKVMIPHAAFLLSVLATENAPAEIICCAAVWLLMIRS